MRELQKLAANTLAEILSGAALHQVLPQRLQALSTAGERGALQDIVYGSLRYLGRLNVWLEALLQRPLTDPQLGWLLRVALYQLAFTRAPAHAVVHNAVTAAGKSWQGGLANAVLRSFQRRRAELEQLAQASLTGRWSHPMWWINKVQVDYPSDWQDILQSGLSHPPFTLRVNVRRGSTQQYLQRLSDAGMAAQQTGAVAVTLDKPVPVQLLPGFDQGDVSVQDAGAQLAAPLLDVEPGQRVLDACAAPGGKTGHLLETANLSVTALDIDAARLARVEQNLDRLKLNAQLVQGDAAQPGTWWDGRPFERILADVPCSASGVVRRNPDSKWLRRPEDIAGFGRQQAAILDALWPTLAAGGKLLYATCSIFPEENALQVEAFIDRQNMLSRASMGKNTVARCPMPINGQILPNATHDGFYYALLRKL